MPEVRQRGVRPTPDARHLCQAGRCAQKEPPGKRSGLSHECPRRTGSTVVWMGVSGLLSTILLNKHICRRKDSHHVGCVYFLRGERRLTLMEVWVCHSYQAFFWLGQKSPGKPQQPGLI